MFADIFHRIIDANEQIYDKIKGGHG